MHLVCFFFYFLKAIKSLTVTLFVAMPIKILNLLLSIFLLSKKIIFIHFSRPDYSKLLCKATNAFLALSCS